MTFFVVEIFQFGEDTKGDILTNYDVSDIPVCWQSSLFYVYF